MEFTVKGKRYSLDRQDIEQRLQGIEPEPITLHAVVISGHEFPVKQAFAEALRIDRLSFTTAQARDIFSRLGFELARRQRRDEWRPLR